MGTWHAANWGYLLAEIQRVGRAIERFGTAEPPSAIPVELIERAPAIVRLCRVFELGAFERDVVIACAALEVDPAFAQRCATALKSPVPCRPTLGLALAAFAGGHVGALAPHAALRRQRIAELVDGSPLVSAPLRLDERILQFLIGERGIDARLAPWIRELGEPAAPAHRAAAIERLRQATGAIGLIGGGADERKAVVAAAKPRAFALRARDVPADPVTRQMLVELWRREAMLEGAVLVLECDGETRADAAALVEDVGGTVVVSAAQPPAFPRPLGLTIELADEPWGDRLARWRDAIGARAVDEDLERVASQFALDATSIAQIASTVANGDELWAACRMHARPRLDELAQRIEPRATWDDLVLPVDVLRSLRGISSHLRHRYQVYERWGFGARTTRGLGTGALFAGASGTGKTLAAEVIAREARLDLYHIDLSQLVNKYVGETEKNLRLVFDAAEAGGAVLLFDEADALFGKRGAVEKGTDRYANLEVSYLLQRMEAYRGLAILTTNQRDALDSAFLRRLRFVVGFPFPDQEQRMLLWTRVLPSTAPRIGIDVHKLARLKLPGGNIRNIALNAAFMAAEDKQPISMRHMLDAARGEFAKIEHPFPEAEVAGW